MSDPFRCGECSLLRCGCPLGPLPPSDAVNADVIVANDRVVFPCPRCGGCDSNCAPLDEPGRMQSQAWLDSMLAKASPLMASIIEDHLRDVGLMDMYRHRGLLEAQMEFIESL